MVIYEQEIKERLKNASATPAERFRADICEAAAKALPQVTVFYSAREQGANEPAAFVRTEKMTVCRRLGGIERVVMTVAVRYLPKRRADDAENERFIEAMSEAVRSLDGYLTVFCGERTEKGARVTLTLCFEQTVGFNDENGVMRILKMKEE